MVNRGKTGGEYCKVGNIARQVANVRHSATHKLEYCEVVIPTALVAWNMR